jgi:hypothetical protein
MEFLFADRGPFLRLWSVQCGPLFRIILSFLIGIFSLAYGLFLSLSSSHLSSHRIRYDNVCEESSTVCIVNFTISEGMTGPIVLLYELANFHQNHRRMYNSKSYPQLAGEYAQGAQLSGCSPVIYADPREDDSSLYLPCGSMALSFFNDSFNFLNTTSATFREDDIALSIDRRDRYRPLNSHYSKGIRHLLNHSDFPGETMNEHFMVWMRASAFPTFLKLYARCENCELPIGTYSILVKRNYPQYEGGERYLIVAETSIVGSRFVMLPIASFVLFGTAVGLGLVLMIVQAFAKPVQALAVHDLELELLSASDPREDASQ